MRFWAGMLFCLWLQIGQTQNCDLSISVPDDVTLCDPGSVFLDGQIFGNYYGFEWVGSNGYYNNTNINPIANITENTTFTLRAFGDPQINLIQNGDFEFGTYEIASVDITVISE